MQRSAVLAENEIDAASRRRGVLKMPPASAGPIIEKFCLYFQPDRRTARDGRVREHGRLRQPDKIGSVASRPSENLTGSGIPGWPSVSL